ncbi:MAG: cysteine desulfurase [Treponema sp.]|nr:cysteine desulfurase [Treponema sp.]
MDKTLYFDWAGTSPSDEEILRESLEISMKNWGNPSSVHNLGKEARSVLEDARKKCAETLNVKPEQLYFTSGGTESDHIVLLSVAAKPVKGTVLISNIEHPALREMADSLTKCGFQVKSLPADETGIITPEAVVSSLTDNTLLICIMAVNNETGVIQPLKEITAAVKAATKGKRCPKIHADCVQATGKIPLDIKNWDIDSAAFSAHKICGPRGIGLLYLKDKVEPFLKGGGQENGIRSGTENLFGAVAFSKVLEKYLIRKENETATKKFEEQKIDTEWFINELSKISSCTVLPKSRLSNMEKFSPYVVQAAFNNIPGQVMLRALNAKNICISTGSACSAKKASRPVLEAMHIDSKLRETAVRFSFGPGTTRAEMETLLEAVKEVAGTFNK